MTTSPALKAGELDERTVEMALLFSGEPSA